MKKERIVSYKLSQKITIDDLKDISAAGGAGHTAVVTNNGTYSQSGTDTIFDVESDVG